MYALAFIRYREPLEQVVVYQDAHRAYLRELKTNGVLIASGPMDPRFGGLLLRGRGRRRKGARCVRDSDPFVRRAWPSPSSSDGTGYREGRSRQAVAIVYSSTGRPPTRCSWMIRSSTGGSQARYQVPSGYTTAMGPPSQMRRQFAFVRRMPPASDSPSSLRRFFRKSHAATDRSRSQHFGLV